MLTIITATFNVVKAKRVEKLLRCVDSIMALNCKHEYLLIDGGSSDGTVNILRDLEAKIPNVCVISERDNGIYDAYNKGIRSAKGEWLYFLGCDDYIENPKSMEIALHKAENDSLDVIVSPIHEGEGRIEPVKFSSRLQFMGYSHQGVIMRRDVIRELGGFDLQYRISADADLLLRAHLAGKRFGVCDLIYAYFSTGGISSESYERTRIDTTRSIARAFGLSEAEREVLQRRRIFPLRKALPLLFHCDYALRASARCQIGRWLFDKMGLIRQDGSVRWK